MCESYMLQTETPTSKVLVFFLIRLAQLGRLYLLLSIHYHHVYSIGYGGAKYP